jgi:hypothetical protein
LWSGYGSWPTRASRGALVVLRPPRSAQSPAVLPCGVQQLFHVSVRFGIAVVVQCDHHPIQFGASGMAVPAGRRPAGTVRVLLSRDGDAGRAPGDYRGVAGVGELDLADGGAVATAMAPVQAEP